jgi:hypothetical protein
MSAAPQTAGLNIVVPIIWVDGSPGLLPAAFAFPLALGSGTERLPGGLRTGVKEFATSGTTSLFHARPLFDRNRFRKSWSGGLQQQMKGAEGVGQKQ